MYRSKMITNFLKEIKETQTGKNSVRTSRIWNGEGVHIYVCTSLVWTQRTLSYKKKFENVRVVGYIDIYINRIY